jgi:cytochrome c biogenesis protein CcmG/thiol:disulfide interchange protein DsbE
VIRPWGRRPPRRVFRTGLAALVVLLAGVVFAVGLHANRNDTSAAATRPINRPALSLAGATLDGGQVDLRALRGQVVLVNIFASWCGPCRWELPLLADAERRWSGRGLRLVGVDVRDGPDAVRALLDETGAGQLTVLPDPNGVIAVDWGATGVPETFLVDRGGRIVWWARGPVSQTWLQQRVPPLLAA